MSLFRRCISFGEAASEEERERRLETVASLACKLQKSGGEGDDLSASTTFTRDAKVPLLCGARARGEPYAMWSTLAGRRPASGCLHAHATRFYAGFAGLWPQSVSESLPIACAVAWRAKGNEVHFPEKSAAQAEWVKKAVSGGKGKGKGVATRKRARPEKDAASGKREPNEGGDDCMELSGDEEPVFGDLLEDFEADDEDDLQGKGDEDDEYKDWDELGAEMGYGKGKEKKKKRKKRRKSEKKKREGNE